MPEVHRQDLISASHLSSFNLDASFSRKLPSASKSPAWPLLGICIAPKFPPLWLQLLCSPSYHPWVRFVRLTSGLGVGVVNLTISSQTAWQWLAHRRHLITLTQLINQLAHGVPLSSYFNKIVWCSEAPALLQTARSLALTSLRWRPAKDIGAFPLYHAPSGLRSFPCLQFKTGAVKVRRKLWYNVRKDDGLIPLPACKPQGFQSIREFCSFIYTLSWLTVSAKLRWYESSLHSASPWGQSIGDRLLKSESHTKDWVPWPKRAGWPKVSSPFLWDKDPALLT